MVIDYREEMIEIVMQKKKDAPTYKEPALALVAYDGRGVALGLAYRKQETPDGLNFVFQLIHLATGWKVCKVDPTSEKVVRRWIDQLIELADWTARTPALLDKPQTLLGLAVYGALSLLEDEEEESDDDDDDE
jgi:hypothetical protein